MGWQPQQPSMTQQKTDAILDSVRLYLREVKFTSYFLSTILHLQTLQSMV